MGRIRKTFLSRSPDDESVVKVDWKSPGRAEQGEVIQDRLTAGVGTRLTTQGSRAQEHRAQGRVKAR